MVTRTVEQQASGEPPSRTLFACAIFALFLIALLLRLWILHQPLEYLDRLFVPDDTYYTLSISRSIAGGHGPSTDGQTITTGFQPLLVFFQVPLFLVGHDPDWILRAAILESAFFGACGVLALGLLLARISSRGAALLGMAIAALHPLIIKTDLNGLETSLSGMLALLVLLAYAVADTRQNRMAFIALGILCALALLARVDNCFLVGLVVIFVAKRWGWRPATHVVTALAIVGSPWWIYSTAVRGSPVPESGAAVRQIVGFHHAQLQLTLHKAVWSALASIGSWVVPSAPRIKDVGQFGIAAVIFAVMVAFIARQKTRPEPRRAVLRIAVTSAIALIAFYTFVLPAFWFFERYFYVIYLAFALTASVAIGEIAESARRITLGKRKLTEVIVAIAIIAFLARFYRKWEVFFSEPKATVEAGALGAKGYREVAKEVLEHAPANATIGAMQSGALGYYAQTRRVVNLDGVVNGAAYAALRDRQLARYLRQQNIVYFADWDINLRMLRYFYGERMGSQDAQPIFAASPQGPDQFTLYQLSSKD